MPKKADSKSRKAAPKPAPAATAPNPAPPNRNAPRAPGPSAASGQPADLLRHRARAHTLSPSPGRPGAGDGPAPPPHKPRVALRPGLPLQRGQDSPPPPPPDPVATERERRRTTYADHPEKRFRFDGDRRARFLLHVRSGAGIDHACARVGCGTETPYLWDAAGKEALAKFLAGGVLTEREQEQADFHELFRNAQNEVETRLIGAIITQANQDWRAADRMLVMRNPKRYSEKYAVRMAELELTADTRKAEQLGKEIANDLMREKLEAMREVRKNGGQLLVIGGEDVIAALVSANDLPEELRTRVGEWLNEKGFRFLEVRDLGVEPDGKV